MTEKYHIYVNKLLLPFLLIMNLYLSVHNVIHAVLKFSPNATAPTFYSITGPRLSVTPHKVAYNFIASIRHFMSQVSTIMII